MRCRGRALAELPASPRPHFAASNPLLRLLQVGVPFSDPLADGGTIQRANQVALSHGYRLRDCIGAVREARSAGLTAPVVLMGYYNPIVSYGEAKLAADCASAGVDGFIVVDLPPEDASDFLVELDKHGLGFIPLVAPTSTESRLGAIAAAARGFIYCVSVTGVTGARTELPVDLAEFVKRVRARAGATPVAVGFGISSREQAVQVGGLADGVVMGSAIINALQAGGVTGMAEFLSGIIPAKQ
jgi:tryptophan synthase alpha subunit